MKQTLADLLSFIRDLTGTGKDSLRIIRKEVVRELVTDPLTAKEVKDYERISQLFDKL
jgi:hypothetical protein